jgi:hypothetical protein
MYFLLFFLLISSSLLRADIRLGKLSEYFKTHSGAPPLVEGVEPELWCFKREAKLSVEPV